MSRRVNDFYPTPHVAVESLMDEIGLRAGSVFDPAAGDGALLEAARECIGVGDHSTVRYYGMEINPQLCSDAFNNRSVFLLTGDFLSDKLDFSRVALCLSNPPYSMAQEFVDKMLQERGSDTIVAALLRLGFLGSQKRHEWWKEHRPSAIRILSKRPSFTGDGKTDNSEYMWCIWDPPSRSLGLRPLWWY